VAMLRWRREWCGGGGSGWPGCTGGEVRTTWPLSCTVRDERRNEKKKKEKHI